MIEINRQYRIVKPILLTILTINDTESYIVNTGSLSFDGANILYWDKNGNSHTTTLANHSIDVMLEEGALEII